MSKNKVKYNLKNTHYALLTEGENGAVTYGKPVPIPGSVSISLDAQSEISPFHADGVVYFKSVSNNGYDGELEIALVPESFYTDVLGVRLDGKKVLIEDMNVQPKSFALLFEFEGDQNGIRHVLYNCSSTRPSIESKTSEGTKEPVTEKLTISATALSNGYIKAKSGDTTDTVTYDGWYDSVYMPTEGGAA